MTFKSCFTAALLTMAAATHASVIDFNSHAPINDYSSAVIHDSGFSFTVSSFPDNAIAVNFGNPSDPPPGAFNGSHYMVFSEYVAGATTMTMRREDGSAFFLNGFDMGLSWFVQQANVNTVFTISGDLEGGGSFSDATTVGFEFSPIAVGRSITELRINVDLTQGGYVALDNFDIRDSAAVPEPGSLALAAVALAGLGMSRRRKRH